MMAHIRYAQFPKVLSANAGNQSYTFLNYEAKTFFQIGSIKSLFLPAYLPNLICNKVATLNKRFLIVIWRKLLC